MTRDELISIASRYLDGIVTRDGSQVPS